MRIITLALLLLACSGKDDDDDGGGEDSGPATDDGGSEDTGGGDTGGGDGGEDDGMAPSPAPFTVTLAGDSTETLVFDDAYCTQPLGSANFTQFWRSQSDEHFYVLVAQLLGTFEGEGTYDGATHRAVIKLQEEAGGNGNYFASGPADTVEIVVEHLDIDAGQAWGAFSFDAMTSSGSVTATPMPLPIWCPELH